MAKDGRIDEVVERLVRWQGLDDQKKGWEAVYRIATKAAELADHERGKDGPTIRQGWLPSNFAAYMQAVPRAREAALPKGGDALAGTGVLVRAETIDSQIRCGASILAASRSIRLSPETTGTCVILCGGNVQVDRLLLSVVICDGDFITGACARNSLIIARGKVACHGGSAFIIAREAEFPRGDQDDCLVRTGEAHPLGFIKFFDPAEAGVEASAERDGGRVPDGVVVKSVAKDKPFAAAGLQAGDIITAVGDEKIDASGTADDQFQSFRRALRKALANDEEFPLAVRRGDKTLELTVKPAD